MVSSLSTPFIGIPTLEFDILESTNEYAIELASKSNPREGTAVFAYHQSRGKGQIGRKWYSKPGESLCVSIILKPGFLPLSKQYLLNVVSSLAVESTVQSILNEDCFIKWPNDIYIGNRKVAGILIQNILTKNKISFCIMGIGVNVNQLGFSSDLPNPTSLKMHTSQTYDIRSIRDILFKKLQYFYVKMKSNSLGELSRLYTDKLYLKNRESSFINQEGLSFKGTITGIDKMGRLIIKNMNGIRPYLFNEIKFTE